MSKENLGQYPKPPEEVGLEEEKPEFPESVGMRDDGGPVQSSRFNDVLKNLGFGVAVIGSSVGALFGTVYLMDKLFPLTDFDAPITDITRSYYAVMGDRDNTHFYFSVNKSIFPGTSMRLINKKRNEETEIWLKDRDNDGLVDVIKTIHDDNIMDPNKDPEKFRKANKIFNKWKTKLSDLINQAKREWDAKYGVDPLDRYLK